MKKALIVFSGGQDSTTCLYWALNQGWDVHTMTIQYGQRHAVEIQAAKDVCDRAGIPEEKRLLIELPSGTLASTSPLVSGRALDQYEDFHSLPGEGIEDTFIPNRNQLFLTLAANRAVAIGATELVTGVCQEDHGGYPDCRQVFIDAMEQSINLSNEGAAKHITIYTPLMNRTKADAVRLAWSMPECFAALAWSHTAYDGQFPPTGHDHATLLREKGFAEAGLPDPLVLRAHHLGLMELPDTPNYDLESLATVYPVLSDYAWLEIPR